jgi:hypothetical protein
MDENLKTGWGSRSSIIASNLLPAFGVLALGWPAAPAVFLIWLEGWLGILELSAQAAIHAKRQQKEEAPKDALGCAWTLGWPLGILIGLTALSAPAFVAGGALYSLLKRHAPGDPWVGLLDARGLLWAVAAAVVLKAFQVARVMRAESLEPFRTTAQDSYILLVNRCFLLLVLAYLTGGLGRFGLSAFVVLASAALASMEMGGKDIFHRFLIKDKPDRRKGPPA